jgi:hypothetical protein
MGLLFENLAQGHFLSLDGSGLFMNVNVMEKGVRIMDQLKVHSGT